MSTAHARSLTSLLPLINFERMHGVAVYKEVLKRRGIFATSVRRDPGKYLDDLDLAELDAILESGSAVVLLRLHPDFAFLQISR